AASSVPRNKRFTISQGEPAVAPTHTESNAKVSTAHPGHERRRPHWAHIDRARQPAPVAVDVSPTPIVEGSISPGRIIYPRPTPRRNPDPVSKAIGRPSGGH